MRSYKTQQKTRSAAKSTSTLGQPRNGQSPARIAEDVRIRFVRLNLTGKDRTVETALFWPPSNKLTFISSQETRTATETRADEEKRLHLVHFRRSPPIFSLTAFSKHSALQLLPRGPLQQRPPREVAREKTSSSHYPVVFNGCHICSPYPTAPSISIVRAVPRSAHNSTNGKHINVNAFCFLMDNMHCSTIVLLNWRNTEIEEQYVHTQVFFPLLLGRYCIHCIHSNIYQKICPRYKFSVESLMKIIHLTLVFAVHSLARLL